ncbi:MAG: PAS-domain containing protein [Hyphomicrobiales bacterium]|nr:PAS-domain containing protein [Hyphomicrobiales bacterium]MCA1998145.1 PAS-domain containing protein [Hyphomicrobiales bacterium]
MAWRRAGWGLPRRAGLLTRALALLSATGGGALAQEAMELRLPGLAAGLGMAQTAIPLSLALLVITLYAASISILHVRTRKSWNDHFEEMTRSLREAQAAAERANLFLVKDRQFLVAWNGPAGDAEFDGDPGIVVDAANPQRVLDLVEWLDPEQARRIERCILQLRSEGTAFSEQVRSLRGDYVEIEGRPVAGRAVMAIKLATGERLALARMLDEKHALEAAQAQLQSVLDAIPQPIWLRDRRGRLGWVNSAYAQAVEAAGPDAVLSSQTEILDSADRAQIRRVQAIAGRWRGSVTAVMAGQRRKVDVVEVAGPEGGGGFALDVSELDATRKALERQMEAHVRTLDELPSAVAIFDHTQRLTYSNRAFAELFGLDAAFLAAGPTNGEWLDRLRATGRLPEAADYREWKASLLAHYAQTETSEYGWRLANGRALRVVVTPDPQGGLTYLFEDETERFTLETSYEELKNTQWETLMALSEGVGVFGSDGRLQLSNPAFARIWGLAPEALQVGEHVEAIGALCLTCPPDTWRRIVEIACGLAEAREDQHFEVTTTDSRTLMVATTPLPDRATLVTVTDITDTVAQEQRLREHNEALKQAARLRTDFIKSVSFELRSPLTNVVGLAQALAGGVAGPLSPKQLAYAQDLGRSADAVLALTADILDLAGIETGDVEFQPAPVDLAEAIRDAMEGLKDRLGDAKVRLALNLQTGLTTIEADPRRFRHIVFNLIANAVSFSEPGDTVRLAVRRENIGVVIEVTDAGKGPGIGGMADRGLPEVERENGLRYSLAKALVHLHGGRIEIADDPQGGQRTIVVLPNA